jgi:hypothetical protein
MPDFSDTILNTIKEQHITPRPRWFFVLKWSAIWTLLFVTFLVGSLASSAMLFMLTNADWQTYAFLNRSPLAHAIAILPYFWILLVTASVAVVYYNLRQTRHGYRYASYLVIGGSVVASIAVGAILNASGVGLSLDRTFARSVPFYTSFVERNQEIWSRPETGFMAGRIVSINGPESLIVQDLRGDTLLVRPESPTLFLQSFAATGTCIEFFGRRDPSDFDAFSIRTCHNGFDNEFPEWHPEPDGD